MQEFAAARSAEDQQSSAAATASSVLNNHVPSRTSCAGMISSVHSITVVQTEVYKSFILCSYQVMTGRDTHDTVLYGRPM